MSAQSRVPVSGASPPLFRGFLFCLQQPAGLARPASYFHLRPQMKVAKAKGPIRFGSLSWPQTTNKPCSVPTQWLSRTHRIRGQRASEANPIWFVGCRHLLGQIGFRALCFGYFHLGQQMKVTAGGARPAGSDAREAVGHA